MIAKRLFLGAALLLAASPALAHITIETPQSPVGAGYKAVLKINHGCQGSATVKITVDLPEGFVAAKPMPKPGWTVAITTGRYERAYAFYHGAKLEQGPTRITWSGGSLPDAFYDEFVVAGYVASELEAGKTLYFPVVQECEKGSESWNEQPELGHEGHVHLAHPAPAVRLLPAKQ